MSLFFACVPAEIRGDYFQKGFDYIQVGYGELPTSDPLNKTLVIKNLKIIIVGRYAQDQDLKTVSSSDDTAQAMQSTHEIRVMGKKLKGKIILNQVELGNRLKSLMHLIDPEVLCPCRREDFEACVAVRPPNQCGKPGLE